MAIADSVRKLKGQSASVKRYWIALAEEWWSLSADPLVAKFKEGAAAVAATVVVILSLGRDRIDVGQLAVSGAAGIATFVLVGMWRANYRLWNRERDLRRAAVQEQNELILQYLHRPAEIASLVDQVVRVKASTSGLEILNGIWLLQTIAEYEHRATGVGVSALDIINARTKEYVQQQLMRGLPVTALMDSIPGELEVVDSLMVRLAELKTITRIAIAMGKDQAARQRYFLTPTGLEVWRWSLHPLPNLREVPA